MKRISILLVILLGLPLLLRAQDAATEEQLNKLRDQVNTLQISNADLQKRLAEVLKEVQELRAQAARPTGNYAAADDVKHLADAIKEVDRKREADRDLILDELKKLARSGGERRPPPTNPGGERSAGPEKGYEYVIKPGDTLSSVLAEYRKEGVKVSVEEVLKANPGLKPTAMPVGTKVFIPAK